MSTRLQLLFVAAVTAWIRVSGANNKPPLRRMRKMLHIPDLVETTQTTTTMSFETNEQDLFDRLLEGHGYFSLSLSLSYDYDHSGPYEEDSPQTTPTTPTAPSSPTDGGPPATEAQEEPPTPSPILDLGPVPGMFPPAPTPVLVEGAETTSAPTHLATSDPLEVDEENPQSCSNFGACTGFTGDCCPNAQGIFQPCCFEIPPVSTTTSAPVPAPLNQGEEGDSQDDPVTGDEATNAPAHSPTLLGSDFPSLVPSSAPSEAYNRTELIYRRCGVSPEMRSVQLQQVLGTNVNRDAFEFLDQVDARACGNKEAKQRYLVAVLYFALDGVHWNTSTNWLSDAHECEWYGMECSQESITKITLKENNLYGSLPSEVFELTSLTGLSLDHNSIFGSIPDTIGNLQDLIYIELDDNNMEGEIPLSLYSIAGLKALDLNGNNFSGTIDPTLFGQLENLVVLQLEDNQFSGPLPWFGLVIMQDLLVLYLHGNNFDNGGSLDSVCAILSERREVYPGYLQFLTADCDNIACACCSQCFYNTAAAAEPGP